MPNFQNDYKNAQAFDKQGPNTIKQLETNRKAAQTKLEGVKKRIDTALKDAQSLEADAAEHWQAHSHAMEQVKGDCDDLAKLEKLMEKLEDTEDDPGFKAFTNDELKELGTIDKKKKLSEQKAALTTRLKNSIKEIESGSEYVNACKESAADFVKACDQHKSSVNALNELAQKFGAL